MKGCKSDQNTLLRIVSAKVQALYFYYNPPKPGIKLWGCKNWEIPWVSPGQFSFCNTSLVALCPSHFINACKSLFKPLGEWERSAPGKRHFWVLPHRKAFLLSQDQAVGSFGEVRDGLLLCWDVPQRNVARSHPMGLILEQGIIWIMSLQPGLWYK